LGEVCVRRAGVDDEMGVCPQHHLDVRRVAAAGEAPELGQPRIALVEELGFARAQAARPADELVRRDGEDEHARRRPGGEDALDLRGRPDLAPAGIDDGGLRKARPHDKKRCEEPELHAYPTLRRSIDTDFTSAYTG